MAHMSELERLEGFVSKLITGYSTLKEKNRRLQQELSEKREVIDRLRQELSVAERQRSEVGAGLTKMVTMVEEWESDLMSDDSRVEGLQEEEWENREKQINLFRNTKTQEPNKTVEE